MLTGHPTEVCSAANSSQQIRRFAKALDSDLPEAIEEWSESRIVDCLRHGGMSKALAMASPDPFGSFNDLYRGVGQAGIEGAFPNHHLLNSEAAIYT